MKNTVSLTVVDRRVRPAWKDRREDYVAVAMDGEFYRQNSGRRASDSSQATLIRGKKK